MERELRRGSRARSTRDDCSEGLLLLLMTWWAGRGGLAGEFLRGYELREVDLTGNHLASFPPGVLPDGIQVRGCVRPSPCAPERRTRDGPPRTRRWKRSAPSLPRSRSCPTHQGGCAIRVKPCHDVSNGEYSAPASEQAQSLPTGCFEFRRITQLFTLRCWRIGYRQGRSTA